VMMVGQHVGGAAPVASYADGKLLQNLGNFSSDSCAWISEQRSDGWRSLNMNDHMSARFILIQKLKGFLQYLNLRFQTPMKCSDSICKVSENGPELHVLLPWVTVAMH
jgi:hypothetical protein